MLQAALDYYGRGWSIIPIKVGTKKPACRWKSYQTRRPTPAQLNKWFAAGQQNLAVICGAVSGGLVIRDFDSMESYNAWARAHPDLASTLPTVATARGRHVYCIAAHTAIVPLANGEVRGNGYCLLPPSRHPDGPTYRWMLPPPDGLLPHVDDLRAAGFLDDVTQPAPTPDQQQNFDRSGPPAGNSVEETEGTEDTEATEGNVGHKVGGEGGGDAGKDNTNTTNDFMASVSSVPSGNSVAGDADAIEQAILESLPTGRGQRNNQILDLARALKSIPALADAGADDLEPHVRRWHSLAKPVIRTTAWVDTWSEFVYTWSRVKHPKGAGKIQEVLDRAQASPPPQAALRYDDDRYRLLVSLCRELQRAAGEHKPFYLACRTAGRLIGVKHKTAWRWLHLMLHDKVIREVEKGDRTRRRASRYVYLAD